MMDQRKQKVSESNPSNANSNRSSTSRVAASTPAAPLFQTAPPSVQPLKMSV